MLARNGERPATDCTANGVRKLGNTGNADTSKPHTTKSQAPLCAELIGASLKWKRAGEGWRLLDGRRRFGDVVPDGNHAGMWRVVLSGGRLSDTANLSWARNAVLEAATRELEYEARHGAATDPLNCPVSGGVFGGKTSPVRSLRLGVQK